MSIKIASMNFGDCDTILHNTPNGMKNIAEVLGPNGEVYWSSTKELTGIPPLSIRSNGTMLLDYLISGNMSQTGTPSPTTPIQPQETGERTGNLINVPALSGVRWATQYPVLLAAINSLPNGVYTMSISYELTSRNDTTDSSVCGWYIAKDSRVLSNIRRSWETAQIGEIKTVVDTFTIDDNNRGAFTALYLYGCGINGVGPTGTAIVTNIMLNTGSEAISYEPYGQYKIPISSDGENLAPPLSDWVDGYITGGTGGGNLHEPTASKEKASDFIEVLPNTTYTFSFETGNFIGGANAWRTIAEYNERKECIIRPGGASETPQVLTTSSSTKYLRLSYRSFGSSLNTMLNAGSTALPYEPYNHTATPVYLGEVQTTRKIKKLVLDGTESGWRLTGSGRMALAFITAQNPLRNIQCVCSHYKGTAATAYGDLSNGECTVSTMNGNNSELGIYDTNYTTLTDFKTYLQQQYAAGTPVVIWYVLANPQTGIVNEPLRKIGDYADTLSMEQAGVQIPTNRGNTVIDVETTLKPSQMYIKYK